MYSTDEHEARMEKLRDLREAGYVPYKGQYEKTHTTAAALATPDSSLRPPEEVLKAPESSVRTAGRVLTVRDHGSIVFCDIGDGSGEMQVALKGEILDNFDFLKQFVDPGDFLGITGEMFVTKAGAKTLLAKECELLTKALRPLPSKQFGIENQELRYRKRYLDFIFNEEARERMRVSAAFVEAVRQWLLEKKFVEVKTRVLQANYGGALAEPFTTHHRYLDTDFYLRISDELDLKMAVAGGFERVFEFGTDFRNEGIDASHLQEFVMLEWYCAYEDYTTGIEWTKQIVRHGVEQALGTTVCEVMDRDGEKSAIDFAQDIPVRTFKDVLAEYDIDMFAEKEALAKRAAEIGIASEVVETKERAALLDEVFKKQVRPHITQPLIITDYPADLFPLARRKDDDPMVSESYQLIVQGWEIVKGYSELVDPEQQRAAFLEQQHARSAGDTEAMSFNKEYLTAMEHGMPPITGFGMGMERIVALITGASNLKEAVMFPLLAPDDSTPDDLPYA